MAKLLRIILAVSVTVFVGAGLFYGLVSGASAAALEGKTRNLCHNMCTYQRRGSGITLGLLVVFCQNG